MRIRTTRYESLRRNAPLALCGSSLVMVISMFQGWFRSGSRMRNSFEMFRIPQQLGLDGFTGIRVIWFLLPILALGVVGFSVLQQRRVAAGLGALLALIGLVVGAIVLFSPLQSGFGPLFAVIAGLIGLVASPIVALTAKPSMA